jgi:hypothetical protein
MSANTTKLPEHLHAAYEWIDSADEWSEAIASPDSYAREAADNWSNNESGDEVTEADLLSVISWESKRRGVAV